MLTKNKKMIIIIDILLLIFAATFSYMKHSTRKIGIENETIDNINTKIISKEFNLNGITISNINLYSDETGSNFTAKLTNDTDNNLNIRYLKVNFYDEHKKIITSQIILENASILANNNQYINLYRIKDLSKTVDIKFDIKYE